MFSKSLLIALILSFAATAQGQNQFQVLHAFTGGSDGGGVWDSPAFDNKGNLYGTTSGGGTHNGGTVFALAPQANGEWSETVLHNFPSSPNDGGAPNGGPMLDPSGNVYGTTTDGGAYNCGMVYELTPGDGGWTETVLYNFCAHPNDAGASGASLIMDSTGNLYGAAFFPFEVSPNLNGSWTETVLHVFTGENGDGYGAAAGLIMDSAGNLYGDTAHGGGLGGCIIFGCGTVYELRPVREAARGVWSERILYRFGAFVGDGELPSFGQLAMDRFGNLYGATSAGGSDGHGTVFKLSPTPATPTGEWVETILHNFVGGASGLEPGGGVILDHAGNLYGTTIAGGSPLCGCGVVYKLTPGPGGQWQYTLLHTFVGSDGAQPDANLTLGPDGNLYGTTATGGTGGAGVVFEIQIAP
jgi:uncharacterized repeat protein (TIGR03803 family)